MAPKPENIAMTVTPTTPTRDTACDMVSSSVVSLMMGARLVILTKTTRKRDSATETARASTLPDKYGDIITWAKWPGSTRLTMTREAHSTQRQKRWRMSPSRILRISKTTSSSRRKEKEKGEGEHGVDHAVADDAALECVWDVAGHKHACYNGHNAYAHIEERGDHAGAGKGSRRVRCR